MHVDPKSQVPLETPHPDGSKYVITGMTISTQVTGRETCIAPIIAYVQTCGPVFAQLSSTSTLEA